MYKIATILFFLVPLLSNAQAKPDFQKVDSLTYQYFVKGDWKNLIALSKVASSLGIESKFIRQRAGYAYFVTGDFYAALEQYKKAYGYDQSDPVTREYLYFSSLQAGSGSTRYYAGLLSEESATRMGIKRYQPVESFDTEFNLKTNKTTTRSNQVYYRGGINSDLGYRFSLYQAFSYYQQNISNVLTQQPEYLALLKYTLYQKWYIKTAFHHLFTNVGNVAYPANLGFLGISTQLKRFNFEANSSVLNSSAATTLQVGFLAGATFPGSSSAYFNSAIVGMKENSVSRIIYAETAGVKCGKNLWAEGNVTIGNLKNYNTFNSLYVYNSADPSIFRSGLSLIYFLGKHLTVIGNFTFDQQEITNNTTNRYYYQYSYSGGLKWKL